jgi:hypothetical protein
MAIMLGADVASAGGKSAGHGDGSLNALLSTDLGSSSQVLVDALPNQVGH